MSYKPTNDLSLQTHDPVHSDFMPYVELMKWLKDLDNGKYIEIKSVKKITSREDILGYFHVKVFFHVKISPKFALFKKMINRVEDVSLRLSLDSQSLIMHGPPWNEN